MEAMEATNFSLLGNLETFAISKIESNRLVLEFFIYYLETKVQTSE